MVIAMGNLPPFEYSALSARQIRILAPASTDPTGLSWALETVDIDEVSLHFTALSYAWACHTHPDTFPILCNGRQLYVHNNLYTALPFITRRYTSKGALATPYWIDAICINQADDQEKISQIRLMNTIYRHADTVLAWLGLSFNLDSQAFTPQAIELLPLLINEFARSRQPGPGARLTPGFEVDCKLGYLGREGWEAIIHLIRNPYFRRVWMVQEIALAKDITFLCGDHEIDSQLMKKAVFDSWHITRWTLIDLTNGKPMRVTAEYHDDSLVFSIRDMINYDADERKAHKAIRIVNLLDEQGCSAPQDRVLGILGMVEEEFGNASEDLHTYTSIADLYTRFSTMLFEASGLTDVHWWYFMSMAFRKNRIDGLPSWVPDLHHNRTEDRRYVFDNMMTMRVYSDPLWQASSRPRRAAHGPRSGEIVLRGKLVDQVTHIYPEVPYSFPDHTDPPGTTGMKWLAALTALIQWESELSASVLQPSPSSATNKTPARQALPADTYWRALLADFTTDVNTGTQLTQDTWRQFQKAGQRFLKLVPRLQKMKEYVCTLQSRSTSADNT